MSNNMRTNLEGSQIVEPTLYKALNNAIFYDDKQKVRECLRMVDMKNDVYSFDIWNDSNRFDYNIVYMAPLNVAIQYNKPDILKILLEAGASPYEYPEPFYFYGYGRMRHPLYDAIDFDCDQEIIKHLIEFHPDPYFQSQVMFTYLLGIACSKGKFEIVKCMIETKPAVSLGSKESNQPPDNFENKLKPIDIQDNDGITLLMLSANTGHHDIVEYLISKGANIEIKCKSGKTAYYYGNKSKNPKLIQFLRDVYKKKFPEFLI
jgi:hypothetical protein